MEVHELISALASADPENTVLLLESVADSDEWTEISSVLVRVEAWTHETARYRNDDCYETRYPGAAREGFVDRSRIEIVHTE